MALDYLANVKPLEDAGQTDAQIASHFSQLTAKAISCGDIKVMLEERGVVFQDPLTHQLTGGALIAHYSGLAEGTDKQLMAWFLSHVFGRGVEINSDRQPRAAQIVSIIAGLPAGELADAGAALLALGGGQPHAGITEADIVALRNEYNAIVADNARQDQILQLRAEIENTWINGALSDGVSTEAEVRAAIKAGL